jgi:hypothetical protein
MSSNILQSSSRTTGDDGADLLTVIDYTGTPVPNGEEVMRRVKRINKTVLLGFSCGKDSIAAWIALRAAGFHVIPYYLYIVPDLEFIEDSLEYFGNFFGERVLRLPHPSLFRMMRNLVFQAPEHCSIMEACQWPEPSYEDLTDLLREDFGLDKTVYNAAGVRAVDSPNRYRAVKKYGPINHKRRAFWPVWDWRKKKLISEFQRARVKLPIDYKWFGRSFDGLDYRFLGILKRESPSDYRKILEWFPLADVEIKRREYAAKTKAAAAV